MKQLLSLIFFLNNFSITNSLTQQKYIDITDYYNSLLMPVMQDEYDYIESVHPLAIILPTNIEANTFNEVEYINQTINIEHTNHDIDTEPESYDELKCDESLDWSLVEN